MAFLSENTHPPKVLITGSRGFTGQHFWTLLEKNNFKVFGLTNIAPQHEQEFQANITSLDDMCRIIDTVKPDYIVHLAGISHVINKNDQIFYEVNLLGSQNILLALDACKVQPKKILFASSANIYGNPDIEILNEETRSMPVNHYGISKLGMEYMAHTWFEKFPIIITRPFNYTGPGQSKEFLIPKIAHHFKNNAKAIELGNIDVIRDFSDVRFVCDVYLKLLLSSVKSETFNVCSGIGYSLRDILNIFEELTNYRIRIDVNEKLIRRNEVLKLIGSNEKLKKHIGDFSIIPMQETLKQLLEN